MRVNTQTTAGRAIIAGIGVVLLSFLFLLKSEFLSGSTFSNEEVGSITQKVNRSFDLAEKSVFSNPNPEVPDGPHPDADKCICRGTGKILQGDGHETDCPYHAKKEPNSTECTGCKCSTKRTYCNCIEAYGKCSCRSRPRREFFNFLKRR